ncbi:MAG: hypothetical protein NTW21_20730 [Verrucomicrobia bacterium]|nr:hypothetical protein [Verrucomicrobiota bacterium]
MTWHLPGGAATGIRLDMLGHGWSLLGSVAAAARQAGVNESTMRQALRGGRVVRTPAPDGAVSQDRAEGTTKSERSRSDAAAAALPTALHTFTCPGASQSLECGGKGAARHTAVANSGHAYSPLLGVDVDFHPPIGLRQRAAPAAPRRKQRSAGFSRRAKDDGCSARMRQWPIRCSYQGRQARAPYRLAG